MTVDVIVKLLELTSDALFSVRRLQKLHPDQTVEEVLGGILEGLVGGLSGGELLSPGNLPLGQVVVKANVLQHPGTLVEGAETIVRGETVLGQEIVLDDLSNFESHLILIGERILTDQLDNLHLLVLNLENLGGLSTELREFRVVLLVESLKRLQRLSPGIQPVHRREMLPLGELLIQTPETLDNGQGGGGNGISEITTRRRDGTDNGDGSLPLGLTLRRKKKLETMSISKVNGINRWRKGGGGFRRKTNQSNNTTSTFVERGKTSTQVGGVTGIGRHLSQTTGNLTQSLGPTRSGVSHHSNIVTLITVVLGKGNT